MKNQDQCEIDTPDRTQVDVRITPLKAKGKELACAIDGPNVVGGVLELSKGQAHKLVFQLEPGRIPNLKFVPVAEEPFCSKVADCPKKGDQVAQFRQVSLSNGDTTLTVEAEQGTEDVLHYALRITDGDREFICDPIIIND